MELFEKQLSKVRRTANDIAGYLAAAHLDLYVAPVPLAEGTTAADLIAVTANYDGYAQGDLTWQTASISDDGIIESVGTTTVFRPTGANVDETIEGAYITANSDDALLFFGPLDGAPIPMRSALDSLTVIVRYRPADQSLTLAVS